jgi:hypothetical protein
MSSIKSARPSTASSPTRGIAAITLRRITNPGFTSPAKKRGVTDAIKRDLRQRSEIEPVIGHAKADHRMDRNYLRSCEGDATNAVLAAAGYNSADCSRG